VAITVTSSILFPEEAAVVAFLTGMRNEEFFLLNLSPLFLLGVRDVLACLEDGC
jgi:hypothetical protein